MAGKSFPILYIAPASVSEAVLCSGLVKKLQDEAPNPSFTIIANRRVAPLFADTPRIANLVITERRASRRRWFGLLGPLRARRWALVIDLSAGVITGRLRPKRPLSRAPEEPSHKLMEAARLMRLDGEPPAPFLYVGETRRARAATLTRGRGPILVLAPGADWVGKAWPSERYAEVVRRLLAPGSPLAGGRLMLLGDKSAAAEAEPLRGVVSRDRLIDLVGRADLLTCYAVLERTHFFIGSDGPYAQLAGAAGAPTLALFGPSDDRIWRPWGDRVRVVRGARNFEDLLKVDPSLTAAVRHMVDLSVDSVLSSAEVLLDDLRG